MDDVAAAILERTGPLDTFKLQKLVYYAQAWHLVWDNEPLFEEPIEAGPEARRDAGHLPWGECGARCGRVP